MTTEDFLELLDGVKRNGSGWQARCPAHDDRNPSLSITEGESGILLKCHAGCPVEAICEAAGLRTTDLFYERSSGAAEAVYDYVDEQGETLFQVVRFPGKQFRQRRSENEWSVVGVRKVPYNLPLISASIHQGLPVYITEGEKDADAIFSASGRVATCNAGGAGKWQDEFGRYFIGAYVVIVQDKDEPGHKHAEQVKASLDKRAIPCKIVEAREGKDASDHLAAGYTVDQFVEVGHRLNYEPLDLFQPVPPVDWVIENICVGSEATLLVADGGSGKSYFALAACKAVAGGQPFLGCDVKPGRVIYVDEEGSRDLALQRMAELGFTDEEKRQMHYLNFAGVDMVRYPDRLLEDAKILQPVFIVIDSHAKVTRVSEENSNSEMGQAWDDGFLPLARETGAALLVIHHTSKDGSGRGATQIRNSADQVLTMSRQEDDSQVVWPSKPRRLTEQIQFRFTPVGPHRYELQKWPPAPPPYDGDYYDLSDEERELLHG